jgi:hypothetical protein
VELRQEFDHMARVGGTPRDYGLKVQTHPALLVTSRVKMRNGMDMQLSYAGSISETTVFHRNADKTSRLPSNWSEGFPTPVSAISSGSARPMEATGGVDRAFGRTSRTPRFLSS